MRLFLCSLALVAFGGISVAAYAPSSLHSHSNIIFTDVCGNVKAQLIVPGLNGIPVPVGPIDKCYCQSQIPQIVVVDPVAIKASKIVGPITTAKELTNLLLLSVDHKTCFYPDHAVPICLPGDPCSFTCKDGFLPKPPLLPIDCVCEWPLQVCNGICGPFKACPSGHLSRRDTLRKRAACEAGKTACGIYGKLNALGKPWDCLDTDTDLESCGGCATPLDDFSPHGVDCTAIPGVVDVSCQSGVCSVKRCAAGYSVSADGTFCLSQTSLLEQN